MDELKRLLKTFTDRWNQLSFNQQIVVGTLLIAIVASSAFLFQQANNDYEVLYANLSPQDASAISAKLKEEKREHRLANDGTTILVPRSQKDESVLLTANELKDSNDIRITEIPPVLSKDVQREMIHQMNTSAIEKIIKSISGINNAKVIIAEPEDNLFVDEEDPPTASVMLMVEPGFRLGEEKIKTIKNLVAHSFPGLKAENVSIADNSGNSLEGPNSASGMLSSAENRRRKYESDTEKKVRRVLSPVVGAENVVVSVSAVLNFDQSQSKIHRIIPAGGGSENPTGVVVSNQSQKESYTGGAKKEVGGEVGTNANAEVTSETPTYASNSATGKDGKEYQNESTTTNYEHSTEDKEVVYYPGSVERMTVGVVLNKVLTAQETEEIQSLVANAAGADFARGDSIDIKGFQFTQPAEGTGEAAAAAAATKAQEQAFWLQLATILTVGLMVVVASVLFFNFIKQPAEGELVEEDEPYEYFEEPDGLLEDGPIPMIEAKIDPEMEHMREAINHAIHQDPQDAARLLVTYMKDI